MPCVRTFSTSQPAQRQLLKDVMVCNFVFDFPNSKTQHGAYNILRTRPALGLLFSFAFPSKVLLDRFNITSRSVSRNAKHDICTESPLSIQLWKLSSFPTASDLPPSSPPSRGVFWATPSQKTPCPILQEPFPSFQTPLISPQFATCCYNGR